MPYSVLAPLFEGARSPAQIDTLDVRMTHIAAMHAQGRRGTAGDRMAKEVVARLMQADEVTLRLAGGLF